MSGLKAALYKDLKLFLSGSGAAALLLPFVLLLALWLGLGDLTTQSYIQPFPIAVRDEDDTVMSRSLLAQMRRIELFSQVTVLEEESDDLQALQEGAAAVITIPKDFFYDLYTMTDCPVSIILNEDMPLESALISSIFRSVMDIIRGNQVASSAVYKLCYGTLSQEQQQALYNEASVNLLQDALGRQGVFENEAVQTDLQGALERRLAACVLSVLALFFSISAVKTLPEELGLGVLPRYRALGGSMAAFICSKFLVACLLTLPTLILMLAVFRPAAPLLFLALALLLLVAAFGLLLGLAAWLRDPSSVQRWGNLLLFLSLVLGGTLWPRHLLTKPLALLGKFTLPYYASLGLEAGAAGLGWEELPGLLWPLPVMGVAGLLAALLALKRTSRSGRPVISSHVESSEPVAGEHPQSSVRPHSFLSRLAGLSAFKLRAMAGGWRGLIALLAVAALCGSAAASVQTGGRQQLCLAVCDLDQSAASQELLQRLTGRAELSLQLCGPEEGRYLLLLGEVEGLLTIGEGYGQALSDDGQIPLRYEGAAAAVSLQGAREIVAGQVSVQRSRARAEWDAQVHLGRSLTAAESARLQALMDETEASMPPLYYQQTQSGAQAPLPFVPSQLSFAALMVLFTLLTAAAWTGGRDGRLVERRMWALPFGRALSYGSDCLALTALGLLTSLAVMVRGGGTGLWAICAAIAYAVCVSALALALIRVTQTDGRIDGLAPFLALILCLLGGCFLDLSQLSPALLGVSLLTPPGLALQASRGLWPCLLVLLGAAAVLFALGIRLRPKH